VSPGLDGALMAIVASGALAVAGGVSGSRAVATVPFNYGGFTIEIPEDRAEVISSALARNGIANLSSPPGWQALANIARDGLESVSREQRRASKAKRADLDVIGGEYAALLYLSEMLRRIDRPSVGAPAEAPVSVGDAVTLPEGAPRAFYGIKPGETWAVTSIGGAPPTARLRRVNAAGRFTGSSLDISLKALRSMLPPASKVFTLTLGLKS
jgi:hypothetical protein